MLQLCGAFCDPAEEEEGEITTEENVDDDEEAEHDTVDNNDIKGSQHSRFKLLYETILQTGLPTMSNLTTSEVVLCLDPMRRYSATPAPPTISLTAATIIRAKEALGVNLEAAAAVHSDNTQEVASPLQEGRSGECQPGPSPEPAAPSEDPLPQSWKDIPNSSSPAPSSSVTGSQTSFSKQISKEYGPTSELNLDVEVPDLNLDPRLAHPEMGIHNDNTTYSAIRLESLLNPSEHNDEHHPCLHPATNSSGEDMSRLPLSAAKRERECERERAVSFSSNGGPSSSEQFAPNVPADDNQGSTSDGPNLSTFQETTPETGRHGMMGADLGAVQDDTSLLLASVSLDSAFAAPQPSTLVCGTPSPRPVTPGKRTAFEAAIDFTEDDDEIAPGMLTGACQIKSSRSAWAQEVEHDTKAVVAVLQDGQWLSDAAMSVFAQAWTAAATKTITMRSTFINPGLEASKTTRSLHAAIYAGHADTLACVLHSQNHWRALVAVPSEKTFRIYDSMRHSHRPGSLHGSHDPQHSALARLANLVFSETQVPPKDPTQDSQKSWTVEYPPTARQSNGYDCGVYAIVTLLRLTVGVDPAEELNAEEAKVWRLVLTALVSKTSLAAAMPWSYDEGVQLTLATLQARRRSSGASVLPQQSNTKINSEELLQTQLGDALITVQIRCDVFTRRKKDLQQAVARVLKAEQLLKPLDPLICGAIQEVRSRFQTAQDEEARLKKFIENLEQPFIIWPGCASTVPWATELRECRDRTGMLRRLWETHLETQEATLVRLRSLKLAEAVTRLNRWVGKYGRLIAGLEIKIASLRSLAAPDDGDSDPG